MFSSISVKVSLKFQDLLKTKLFQFFSSKSSSGHPEKCFEKQTEIPSEGLRFFRTKSENFNGFSIYLPKKVISSKCFTRLVECNYDNMAEKVVPQRPSENYFETSLPSWIFSPYIFDKPVQRR